MTTADAPEPAREPARASLRHIDLHKIGVGRFLATNGRGGVLPVGSGDDPDFTPVELLLAALAGCSAIDVDLITGKRAVATTFEVEAEGDTLLRPEETTAADALAAAALRSYRPEPKEEELDADAVFAKLKSLKGPVEEDEDEA